MNIPGLALSIVIFLILMSLPFFFETQALKVGSPETANAFHDFFESLGPIWWLICIGVAIATYIGISRKYGEA